MEHFEIILLFGTVAFVYASAGFGGGSSYLAILSLYALPFKEMRLIALLCNIVVSAGGTVHFVRKKQLPTRRIIPLVLFSVPAAYLGAAFRLSEHIFFL